MYSVVDYGRMIDDDPRMTAFQKALEKTIKPGCIVLDLGAGTGIMALLACRFGAKRVYAIEPSNVLQVARETARSNALDHRIVFIQKPSACATLPERVDLIIEDMRGALPWLSTRMRDVIDARERFLKPHGRIIPAIDTVFCAVVAAANQFRDRLLPWQSRPRDLDLSCAARFVENTPVGVKFESEQLLSTPSTLTAIDYASFVGENVVGTISLEAQRADTAHGLVLWFETELVQNVKISNAPGRAKNVYGQLFLPWPQPIAINKGCRMEVALRADLIGDDYVWTWETQCGEHHFRQSSFAAAPLTSESLSRRAAHHRPMLSEDGKAIRFALEQMSGKLTLSDLGGALFREFPKRFRSEKAAFEFASRLSGDYSE